jgi:hypothetical protein
MKKLDKEYQQKILDWIPNEILDFHTHIGISENIGEISEERNRTTFIQDANDHSFEKMTGRFEKLLPGIKMTFVSFPFPFKEIHVEKANEYVLEKANYPFILGNLSNHNQTIELLNSKKVKGLKVYYDQVEKKYDDVVIKDFLPEVFLEKLDSEKKILMLHVPGHCLNDSKNISEISEICKKYKNFKLVLAHMGRCHKGREIVESFEKLGKYENIFLETSTIAMAEVFEESIKILGTEKILYGSDAPYGNPKGNIFDIPGVMRNAFITEEVYPWTLPKLRDWYLENKPPLTFLLYHQLEAMRLACKKLNLRYSDLEKIFLKNGKNLLENI